MIVWIGTLLVVPSTAAAQYLDPGTGSMLLQGLIALIGATLLTIGIYWRATMELIRRVRRRQSDPKPDRKGDS